MHFRNLRTNQRIRCARYGTSSWTIRSICKRPGAPCIQPNFPRKPRAQFTFTPAAGPGSMAVPSARVTDVPLSTRISGQYDGPLSAVVLGRRRHGGKMINPDVVGFRKQRAAPPVPRSWQVKRLIWAVVEGTVYRWSFHTMNGWRAWLLRRFGATIGPGCTIRRTSRVYYPWLFTMGGVSCLGDRAVVYNLAPVTIGERVMVSQEAYLCAGSHDHRFQAMPLIAKPITLGDDSWVCARVFVGPGVDVGPGAIVGAMAVAMRNVDAWAIVAGNPATFIRERERPQ